MLWKILLLSGYSAFIVILLFQVPCSAQKVHRCEHPSSCGNLINISYPFRLEGDPSNCGDRKYELACENNQAILNLFSGKYYVKAIDYDQQTIQVVDVGVQDWNCSSLPLYSLNYSNFSIGDPYWPSYIPDGFVMFLSCKTPMKSDLYVDASPCLDGKGYQYALAGRIMASQIGDWCTIDLTVIAIAMSENVHGNLSIRNIHNSLAFGFELSWSTLHCEDCKGQGFCLYDRATYTIRCSNPCSWLHVSSFNCAIWLTVQLFFYLLYCAILFIGLPLLAIRIVCGVPCVFIFLIYKWRRRHLSMFDSVEEFLQNHNNLMPIRYSYSQLKKMTNGFKDKLGEGGYGSVYKGKLLSGNLVAIKILGKSEGNGQEFINEVATIGRIHHVNIVKLIGFCAEGSKRALVYDFMPNGSLDKYILSCDNDISLSWEKMHEISLGVARGIEYLHRGCDMQILHFDIKPHNILLDENFTPKVSDFGLAKLYPSNNVVVSLTAARGTIGYIAPELFYKNIGGVSYKADVYSFGMLLMEMAGKRKNNEVAEDTREIYFPFSVYDQLMDEKEIEIGDATALEKQIVRKMVTVALWCIQLNPTNRPPMNEVVKMLEDSETIQMPPKLFLYPEETSVKDDTNPTWPLSGSVASMEV